MNNTVRDPILFLDNLLRTLILAGVILVAGVMISPRSSASLGAAVIALIVGFLSFMVASQFLVSVEMEDPEGEAIKQARSLRLVIPFLLGWVAYVTGGVLVCAHFI